MDQSALANEDSNAKSKAQKETIDSEVEGLKKELDCLQQMWVTETDELGKGTKLHGKLEQQGES